MQEFEESQAQSLKVAAPASVGPCVELTSMASARAILSPSPQQLVGVPPNELTSSHRRDWLAGTPWHKHVPARIEPIAASDRQPDERSAT
jgi:hypothetical protein